MNRVFLIHGWEGRPDNHWFPWLRMELAARGWEVNAPQMPAGTRIYADKERRWTQMPKVKEWLSFLKDYVGKPDTDTYFVGHSLGCIAIARYLAELPSNMNYAQDTKVRNTPSAFGISPSKEGEKRKRSEIIRVGGCVFVAGFSGRLNIPEIAEFYSLPFDPEKARIHCNKFVIIFSDNDSYVPVAKSLELAKQLSAKTILERGRGHFRTSDGVAALPSGLNVLLKMSEGQG